MTDDHEPDGTDTDIERVEALLREMSSEDGELLELPDDVWAGIEAEVDMADDQADVVVLDRPRRFSSRMAVVSAVAAAAVIIVGGIAVVTQRDEGGPTVVASAELAYDPASFDELGADAAANVSLVDDDGILRVEIDESDLPSPSGESADLELWLIEPDADGNPAELVSLGVIDPEKPGDFEVPADYDPDVYFVVDISVEPRDGNANHSGRSILRGPLTET
ncbi:MAG: anti-sigma factor [Acidimicrobiia bacterium]|nr:anti-sigma factor [Acidimicrobiia bacterium]